MPTTVDNANAANLSPFEAKAREVLSRVRAALAEVIASLVGHHDVRAADLVQSIGVDSRLAWKFVKVLEPRDPLRAMKYVPGERGIRLFLRAAARGKAPRPAVDEARRAFADLQAFMQSEAGSRKLFDMIVNGHTRAADIDVGLEQRKTAYEANSYIWGVQARMQVHTYLIQPSGDGETIDAAVIRGFVDLRRVRPQVPWRISRFYTIDDAGEVRGEFPREPIDPGAAQLDVPLVTGFCSQPLPTVRRCVGPFGIIDNVLAESGVSKAQSVTCLTGEVIRRAEPCYPDERHGGLGTKAPLRTPAKLVVMDVFLNRELFGEISPGLRLASDMFTENLGTHYTEADLLPIAARVERLSCRPDVPPIREMGRYRELISYCCERLGWKTADFDCYRVRLAFPPVPAALLVDVPLPTRT
ncbi:MAG: hypothetical protein PVJ57_16325 [Phycisphaerae bacterium]|jgi:hypothetical protein